MNFSNTMIIFYALLIWRGLVIARRAPDMLGTLIAAGLVVSVGIQAAIKKHYRKRQWPKPAVMEKIARPWAPYRSIACWYLWKSLDVKTVEK